MSFKPTLRPCVQHAALVALAHRARISTALFVVDPCLGSSIRAADLGRSRTGPIDPTTGLRIARRVPFVKAPCSVRISSGPGCGATMITLLPNETRASQALRVRQRATTLTGDRPWMRPQE